MVYTEFFPAKGEGNSRNTSITFSGRWKKKFSALRSPWQQDLCSFIRRKLNRRHCTQDPFPERLCLRCLPDFYLSCSSERAASTWPLSPENFKCQLCQPPATWEPLTGGATLSFQALITIFVKAVATVPKIFEWLVLHPYESCHLVHILQNAKFLRHITI